MKKNKTVLQKLRKLQQINNLPTLPTVATQLLEMLGEEMVSINDISKLMERDPAITAQILKVSNSAYYGLRKEIDTVPRALIVLGVNEIANIILSLSLFKTFTNVDDTEFDIKTFWKHSGVVAYLSRFLAREFELDTHGEEFTAGLMHDLGKIILDQYYHDDYKEVIKEMRNLKLTSSEAEKNVLGFNHAKVGNWLSKKWRIPKNISKAILYHHDPNNCSEPLLPTLVNIADNMVIDFHIHQKFLIKRNKYEDNPNYNLINIDNDKIASEEFRDKIKGEIDKALEFVAVLF